MKQIASILLALVFARSLAACGSTTEDIQKPSNVTTPDPQTNTEVTITETVLVEESGIKITAKGLNTDSLFGPELKLLIENNSGKNLTFQCNNASINGYMVETLMSVEVVTGKKANDSLTFMDSDLADSGITAIADMEFSFHIFETENWEAYLDTKTIVLKTSLADTFEYTYDDSGDLVYEGNDIKIVVKGLSKDPSIFGPGVVVYIENNSNQNVTVQAGDVSINGFMVEPIFSSSVVSGKRAVSTITFMDSDLEKNEISSIENIELSFHIFQTDNWDTIVDTDMVKLTF